MRELIRQTNKEIMEDFSLKSGDIILGPLLIILIVVLSLKMGLLKAAILMVTVLIFTAVFVYWVILAINLTDKKHDNSTGI